MCGEGVLGVLSSLEIVRKIKKSRRCSGTLEMHSVCGTEQRGERFEDGLF